MPERSKNESLPDAVSTATPRTDRAIRIWIVIHGLIVLGWFVHWAHYQYRMSIAEPAEDLWLLLLLSPTFYAIPLMCIIDFAIFLIAISRMQRLTLLIWLLDVMLIAAQMKFVLPLIQ